VGRFESSSQLSRILLVISITVAAAGLFPRPVVAQDTDSAAVAQCEVCADTALNEGEEITAFTTLGASYSGQYLYVSPTEHLLVISTIVDSRPGELKVPFDQVDHVTFRRRRQIDRDQIGLGMVVGAVIGIGIATATTTDHERILGHQDSQQTLRIGILGMAAGALGVYISSLFPEKHTLWCRPAPPTQPFDERI